MPCRPGAPQPELPTDLAAAASPAGEFDENLQGLHVEGLSPTQDHLLGAGLEEGIDLVERGRHLTDIHPLDRPGVATHLGAALGEDLVLALPGLQPDRGPVFSQAGG